jgi:endogenous inhibitor of DNA gyrase (YacG/DUF329 family)
MAKENDKWIKRWAIESSSGGGNYIVGQDTEGNYGCDCPGWTRNVKKYCPECGTNIPRGTQNMCPRCNKTVVARVERQDCRHIRIVKGGGGKSLSESVMDRLLNRA